MSIDSKKLRKVAGAYATGVTVVTVELPDGSIKGMTANSFVSISLSPPIVSFSVRVQSSMMQYLVEGKVIGISILSEEQENISNHFAGKFDPELEIKMIAHDSGANTISDSLAWYCTTIQSILPAGDHFIVLCEVLDLGRNEKGKPLLYYSGYQRLQHKTV